MTERIIAETRTGHEWRAWFADRPEAVSRSPWVDLAVCRLLDRSRESQIEFDRLLPDEPRCRDGHLEFIAEDR